MSKKATKKNVKSAVAVPKQNVKKGSPLVKKQEKPKVSAKATEIDDIFDSIPKKQEKSKQVAQKSGKDETKKKAVVETKRKDPEPPKSKKKKKKKSNAKKPKDPAPMVPNKDEHSDPEDSIDSIFAEGKKAKGKQQKQDLAAKNAAKQRQIAKQILLGDELKKERTTEEGYKIYSAEELKIGKGGETDLCPFDCECCF
eukprot:TRINITY_DN1215_c0_g1_i3.p1 TRINITY_DN1215_c0_g1~~TRINITY_DN1215_c0_g1_i3.p1  ORF type:complete len:210 (-),score=9.22 TRINITY_DN1215_c0_g1_i3:76-669(-)